MTVVSWTQITYTALVLQLGWIIYTILYRLLLSPLAKFPGPRLAALTSWYEFYYDVVQPGQYVFKIRDLHAEYGPIVRVTPRELHVKDLDFLDDLYAPSLRRRDKDWFQVASFPLKLSVGGTTNFDIHKQRREALNLFFNKRSVLGLESMIRRKAEQLCQALEEHMKQQTPANLSDLYFGLAMDVVSQYSFGNNNNLLKDEAECGTLRRNLTELLLGVKFSAHFPWVIDALDKLPLSLSQNLVPPGVINMMELSTKIRADIQQVLDDKDNVKKGEKRSIFYELRDSPTLPAPEKSLTRLEQEGVLLIMAETAGTESTAKSIVITHFHLLANPKILAKLRAELRTVPDAASWTELEQLPYFTAVITEGNRLSFGVTGRTCRVAPDEALQYKSYKIPPGTPVSMTSLCVHTDEKVFPDPWTFNPDRWLGLEGAERRKYQMAFSKGGRKCIGINLAHAELYLVIAAMARYDMKLFETDISDVEFRHDYQVAHPRLDSKGVRALVRGRMAMG
ncbi:MAG: hypothetical protein Q9187_001696 [Circinaria calcarea]